MGQPIRSILLSLLGLIFLLSCTCGRSAGTLVSLIDQIPESTPAGPWRVVLYETDTRILQRHAKGFRQKETEAGDLFVSLAEPPTFQFPCLIRPEERLLIHLGIRVDESDSPARHEGTGMVRVRVLHHGNEIASSESPLAHPEITLHLGARMDAVDQLIFDFALPSGSALTVSLIAAIALEEDANHRDIARAEALVQRAGRLTSRFFEGSQHESAGLGDLLLRKRFSYALDSGTIDGCTKECIALVGTDTLTCEVPRSDVEYRLQLWERGLEESGLGCSLSIEVESTVGWAHLCTIGADDLIHVRWREFDSETPIRPGTQRIRFLFHSQHDVLFLADPLLLPVTKRRSERLNLVLIILDTLRSDRIGSYGYTTRPTSARLDSLAEARGFFLFERAYAPSPWTVPSIAKLFVSRYRDVDAPKEIPRSYTLLAERMRNAGYYCAGFTGGLFLRFRGFEQGFHEYSWTRVSGKVEHSFPQATQWVIDDRTDPFFLFLHTYETHEPLTRDRFCKNLPCGRLGNLSREEPLIPPNWRGWKCARLSREESTYVQAAYDGAVRTVCDATVDFLARFDELDLWENTVVLITSDHGEEFWDHFQGFSKHGHSLYGELLNVPLLLYVPELSTKHLQSISTEVSLVDVVPTLGELLGLELPEPVDGISLCPFLRGEKVGRSCPILATHHDANLQRTLRVCSITDGIKHIEPISIQNIPTSSHRACFHWELERELYDLDRDPREQNNEALLKPDMADTLAAGTKAALAQSLAPMDLSSDASFVPSLPHSLREQLKAVGYLEN